MAAAAFLAISVLQGYQQKKAGKARAAALEASANQAREMQEYEREVAHQNLLVIQSQEKEEIKKQEYANEEILGSVTAAMGATGVQTTGSMLDLMAEEVILGANKNAIIRSQSLRQQTQATNAGNLAIYQNEYKEYAYGIEAQNARRAAKMAMVMGVAKGLAGFYMMGGDFSTMFASSSGATALTAPTSEVVTTSNWLYF